MNEQCGPSSADLKTAITSFLQRANDVDQHPLGHSQSTINVRMRLDLKTGMIQPVGYDSNMLPKFDVMSLATVMRPIIWLETEPISYNVLTKRIEREHAELRGRLKLGRTRFAAWKKHVFAYGAPLDLSPPPPPPADQDGPVRGHIGPPGVIPSGTSPDDVSTDYQYADAYLNACVWHSDNDKAALYHQANDFMKEHYQKCAELRTLSAAEIVLSLRQWILDARADGHDF